jgi:hypothetical protein
MQSSDLAHFLLCGVRLASGAQRKTQVVVSIFEIRVQPDGALEGGDSASQVAAGFQFLAKIELCWGIVAIDAYCFAELRKGGSVIALSLPPACEPRPAADSAQKKLRGSLALEHRAGPAIFSRPLAAHLEACLLATGIRLRAPRDQPCAVWCNARRRSCRRCRGRSRSRSPTLRCPRWFCRLPEQ